MSPLTVLRLAAANNRSDTVRIALTAVGAMLGTTAVLAAATVLSIVTPKGLRVSGNLAMIEKAPGIHVTDESYVLPYSNGLLNEAGLRPGVAFALLLLTIPVLAFVAQCSKLGAPARDRRLAAIRMAGGTPRQVVWVAAVETGLAAIIGVGLGFGGYFLGRHLIDNPDARGTRPLPTDVLPAVPWMVGVAIAVPLLVTLLAVGTLRHVAIGPLGVVRGSRAARPGRAPGVLLALGIGAAALLEPVSRYLDRRDTAPQVVGYALAALMFVAVLLVSFGVVTGTGWITHAVGRLLHRFARRPTGLLAGRRMMADPWSGSRTLAAMLVALVIGAFAAGIHAVTLTSSRADQLSFQRGAEQRGEPYLGDDTSFYDRAYQLIGYAAVVAVVIAAAGLLVALADSIASRRRTLSALTASGTPRGVLARATAWQVLAPVLPAVLLAVSAGVALPRLVFREVTSHGGGYCQPAPGDPVDACRDQAYFEAHGVTDPTVTLAVPVPWEPLALLVGGALGATIFITLIGLLFLRMSTMVSELRTT
ncbi:MAG TPA: FtsX-like permease family protein [Micromonosporaceae bacterium]|nr:FtsX-like permease family protein [Micromonosporaceae bacterium]